MMTPFKFGKKKHKDGDTPQKRAASGEGHSPQTSMNSAGSKAQGSPSLPKGLPSQSSSSITTGQQFQNVNATPLGFDHNNNIYNQRSPQRGNVAPSPHQRQFGSAPAYDPFQQQQNGFNQNQQGNFQQSSPSQSHFQYKPNTPWSRTKLLFSPFPRYRHGASQHANERNELFVMGGLHNTSVYGDTWIIKQDQETGQFQTLQVEISDNSPSPRVGHASTTCGNAFVVFGGDTVTNDDGEIDNDLYLFNTSSHTWTIPRPTGRKPTGRYGHTIGVISVRNFDSKLFLYGGQLDDAIHNDLVMFNLSSFRRPDCHWEWITPADPVRPPPLTNHTMDVYDNKLWLFGGSTGHKLVNDLWVYDPASNKWDNPKTFGTPPPPVEEHASVIHKDCLIIYGGKDSAGQAFQDFFFLNLITKTWFVMNRYPLSPQGKYGHTLSITKDNKLLVLGGQLAEYARLGENLEPSEEDNGVGTLLTMLDVSNLERLVPGLQQYGTPANSSNQERFAGSSIFTPASVKNLSPEKKMLPSPGNFDNANNSRGTPGLKGATVIGTGVATGTAVGTAWNAKNAEAVYNREHEAEPLPSDLSHSTTTHQSDTETKSPDDDAMTPKRSVVSVDDDVDLPLQMPAPLTNSKVDVPAPTSSENSTVPLPGALSKDIENSVNSGNSLDIHKDNGSSKPYGMHSTARSSDILDSYTAYSPATIDEDNDDTPRASVLDHVPSSNVDGDMTGASNETAHGISTAVGTAATAGVAGLLGAVTVGTSSKNNVTGANVGSLNKSAIQTSSAGTVSGISSDEKQRYKEVIDALSKELDALKFSTTESVKAASDKINSLETENIKLKEQINGTYPKEIQDDDENSVKRRFIKLDTDYQLLNKEHEKAKARSTEVESVFTQNLIDLQKLNSIIQSQQETIESQEQALELAKTHESEVNELKSKLEILEKEKAELLEANQKALSESHEEVKKLNVGLSTFLAQYLSKDETTGEYVSKSLATSPQNDETATSLQSHIDELLKENEQISQSKASLERELADSKKYASEVETLKLKLAELSKIEDSYKESVYSVNTANRALQISQSELTKEKELNSKLQNELDELRLFGSKMTSRNVTPIVNDFSNKDNDEDNDVTNARYNLKIRDLQAELYIIKKERDDLKDEALSLKKKLYNATNP